MIDYTPTVPGAKFGVDMYTSLPSRDILNHFCQSGNNRKSGKYEETSEVINTKFGLKLHNGMVYSPSKFEANRLSTFWDIWAAHFSGRLLALDGRSDPRP